MASKLKIVGSPKPTVQEAPGKSSPKNDPYSDVFELAVGNQLTLKPPEFSQVLSQSGFYQLNDTQTKFVPTPEGEELIRSVYNEIAGPDVTPDDRKRFYENFGYFSRVFQNVRDAAVKVLARKSEKFQRLLSKDGAPDRSALSRYVDEQAAATEETAGKVGSLQAQIVDSAKPHYDAINGMIERFQRKSGEAVSRAKGALQKLEKESPEYKKLADRISRAEAEGKEYVQQLEGLRDQIFSRQNRENILQRESAPFLEIADEIARTAKQAAKAKYGLAETTTYAEVLKIKGEFDSIAHSTGNMLKEAREKIGAAAKRAKEAAYRIVEKAASYSAPASYAALPA